VTTWDINGMGFRGGAYQNSIADGYLRISDRTDQNHTKETRNQTWGGRGVRTAP
jgi:hypothetical protein